MNKAQKRLVSALAAATSVAAAIAPAATVFAATKDDAKALVDNAKTTLAFVDYNQAYAAVMALPAADQAALLAELSPLWDKVATKDVTDVLKTMDALAANKDLKNYYDLYDMIEKTVSLPRNQQYLMGELTSWGKTAVFTADVTAATDAVIKAYTDKTPESIAAAKEAAAKVTNAGSLAWLNTEIANASKAVPTAVSSVTATTAKTFSVKFTTPVADTSKVVFTVQNASTPITVTATWNTDKTEATLTNSVNFAEGTYTVNVKNDTTDLGTTNVSVVAQKVAKIEVTSNKLSVNANKNNAGNYVGYATYKVLDQYGNDITTSYLANSLTFQSGVGTASWKNGVLTIESATTLAQYSTVVITAYDSTSGVSTSASLSTSTSFGTLNSVELKALTNADGKVLTAGDNATPFYIDFTATDLSDNATKSYDLVKGGLILNGDQLTVSSGYVTAKVVYDPSDSNKAAIEVRATTDTIPMDLPVSITAMTYTGKTSTLNVTLKKQSTLDTFTLQAPNYSIAVNETKDIPFVAYDQSGKQITKFSDFYGSDGKLLVTLATGLRLSENVDGTARLQYDAPGVNGTNVLTAVTSTGKMSSLTINVQKAPNANTLTLGSIVTTLQGGIAADPNVPGDLGVAGASQKIDFGYDKGGLTVNDQYGRSIDMTKAGDTTYQVIPSVTTGSAVSVSGIAASGRNQIVVSVPAGTTSGTGTVTFKLINTADGHAGTVADPHVVIDTKTLTFTVIKNTDIKGYTLDPVANALYAGTTTLTPQNNREQAYYAELYAWGQTAGGAKVKLAGTPIVAAFVDSSDFQIDSIDGTIPNMTTGAAFDGVYVTAHKLADSTKTASSGNVTLTIKTYDGNYKAVSTAVKSTTVDPYATTVAVSADTSYGGVKVDGDVITMSVASFGVNNFAQNNFITRFGSLGTLEGAARSRVYVYAKDQYGTKAMQLGQVTVVTSESTVSTADFNVDQYGKITALNAGNLAGKYVTISAVSTNGLVKTFKIAFTN